MAETPVFRAIGPTHALSVVATQHAAVAVVPTGNDMCNYAAFLNTGPNPVCVVTAPYAATPATPTIAFPVDGTPTGSGAFVLPAVMQYPTVFAVPSSNGNGFCISAIGSAAGPAVIYVTPVCTQ